MKKLQKLGAASRAPPLPTKNPPAVLGPRAGIPPPQRHQTQQRVKFRTLHLQIRTILIVAAALRNTLHTTENKQQHSFLIDSKFANFGPQKKSPAPPKFPARPYSFDAPHYLTHSIHRENPGATGPTTSYASFHESRITNPDLLVTHHSPMCTARFACPCRLC
jgi:hypothetical protein